MAGVVDYVPLSGCPVVLELSDFLVCCFAEASNNTFVTGETQ